MVKMVYQHYVFYFSSMLIYHHAMRQAEFTLHDRETEILPVNKRDEVNTYLLRMASVVINRKTNEFVKVRHSLEDIVDGNTQEPIEWVIQYNG